ncbi:hypothetical protein V8F20_006152 [Naviculisporaceae sp. PSN 640]
MKLSLVGVVAALVGQSQAWQVTAYDNTQTCSADGNTRYRVISGATDNNRCYTFDRDMPGTACTEYTRGGWAKGGCVTGSLIPKSVAFQGGGCRVFSAPDCGAGNNGHYQDSNGGTYGCFRGLETGFGGGIRSFWCYG